MLQMLNGFFMRIIAFSDLHGDLQSLTKITGVLQEFDLLLVAGDFTNFASAKVTGHMITLIAETGIPALYVAGNCDLVETVELYRSLDISLHGEGKIVNGVGFFGVGGSNPTPFNTPLEYSESDIRGMLNSGYREVKDANITVLVSHPPPKGVCDKTAGGVNAGSLAVKEFLQSHEVDLVVCGHIHEAGGIEKIRGTAVVNTGPACNSYASIDISKEQGVSVKLESIL